MARVPFDGDIDTQSSRRRRALPTDDIKIDVTTDDGEKIALAAIGIGIPQPGSPIALLRENVMLATASERYAWVNPLQIWGVGSVDFSTGTVNISAYIPG